MSSVKFLPLDPLQKTNLCGRYKNLRNLVAASEVHLWYAKMPSVFHLTEMLALICSASLRWETPKTNPASENSSQPDRPCDMLTPHVSILSERKALTGFSS